MQNGNLLKQLNISHNSQKFIDYCRKKAKHENIGSALFLALALGASIACAVTGYNAPFLNSFEFFGGLGSHITAYSIFGISNAHWMSGFGHRCGSLGNACRPQNEKKALLVGGGLGTAVGITLFLKAPLLLTALGNYSILPTSLVAAAAGSVVGTGGIVLGAAVAAFAVASVGKSCADSVARAYNYYQYKWGNADVVLREYVKQREKEYKGTFYGVIVGVVLGVIGAILLAPTLPATGIVAGIGVGALVVVAAVAAGGCILSKTYKYFDKYNFKRSISQETEPSASHVLSITSKNIYEPIKPQTTLWQMFCNLLPSRMHSEANKAIAITALIKVKSSSASLIDKLKVNSFAKILMVFRTGSSTNPSIEDLTTPLKLKSLVQLPTKCMIQPHPAKQLNVWRDALKAINDHAIVCTGNRNAQKTQQTEKRRLAAPIMQRAPSVAQHISRVFINQLIV